MPFTLYDSGLGYGQSGRPPRHYYASRIDETGDPSYYGLIAKNGNFIILEVTESSGTILYFAGVADFGDSWTGRAALTYVEYTALFTS